MSAALARLETLDNHDYQSYWRRATGDPEKMDFSSALLAPHDSFFPADSPSWCWVLAEMSTLLEWTVWHSGPGAVGADLSGRPLQRRCRPLQTTESWLSNTGQFTDYRLLEIPSGLVYMPAGISLCQVEGEQSLQSRWAGSLCLGNRAGLGEAAEQGHSSMVKVASSCESTAPEMPWEKHQGHCTSISHLQNRDMACPSHCCHMD